MSQAQIASTRKQCDLTKLLMAGYLIEMNKRNAHDFYVLFHGPKDTLYEGGVWKVHVILPEDYPFASPSIGFEDKMFHPNVDEASGSVCLDVINQTWSPLYSLVNIFEVFLPQLLTYPNAQDPLNSEAAALMNKDKARYEQKVKDYVKLYATQRLAQKAKNGKEIDGGDVAMDKDSGSQASELSKLEQDIDDIDIEDI